MKIQNFLFLFFIFFLSSCQSDKHLLFKNIPISGNFRSFADKLVKTGFTEKQLTEDKQISLKGVFLDRYTGDYTRYDTSSGTISLEVMSDHITIIYLDKRNDKIREKEEKTGKTVENN
jgi:hypothetical protein